MDGIPLLLHVSLCIAAIVLSGYALYVEIAKEKDENFVALCDISHQISCSTVLTSRYSKGFGVIGDLLGDNHPLNLYNSLYGILFYVGNTFLGCWRSPLTLPLMISAELLATLDFVYLCYIMLLVLNDICLLCFSLYAVHCLLLALHCYMWCCSGLGAEKKKVQ